MGDPRVHQSCGPLAPRPWDRCSGDSDPVRGGARRARGTRGDRSRGGGAARQRCGRSARRADTVKSFARLYTALDETTATNEKIAALVEYFSSASPADA